MNLKTLIKVLQQIIIDDPEYSDAEVSYEVQGDLATIQTVSKGYKKNDCFRTEESLINWLDRNNYETIQDANGTSTSGPQITLSITLNAK